MKFRKLYIFLITKKKHSAKFYRSDKNASVRLFYLMEVLGKTLLSKIQMSQIQIKINYRNC